MKPKKKIKAKLLTINDSNRCHTLFPRKDDVNDETGCLKENAHNDSHICQTRNGRLIEWEDDYSCKCGCWDEDDYGSACIIYNDVTDDYQ